MCLFPKIKLFVTFLVPIKLINKGNKGANDGIWQNLTPSSVQFCRPILIEFCKETPEKTIKVIDDMET